MIQLSADSIFTGSKFLDDSWTLRIADDGTVEDLVPAASVQGEIRKLHGVICPGFINSHCHLELSHLKGRVGEHTGLVQFLVEVTQFRDDESPESIARARAAADLEMKEAGIVAVGDVCNGIGSAEQKLKSSLYYHSFAEVLGLSDSDAPSRLEHILGLEAQYREKGLAATASPHAPYSVSASLFRLLGAIKDNGPITIHNQECPEEDNMFMGDKDAFKPVYESLHIDSSSFRPTGKSSLRSWLPLFTEPRKLMIVHNTRTRPEDVRFALSSPHDVSWCLCPNANLYIENELPDVPMFLQAGCRMVLGTDSLSSNHRLSILEEMKTIRSNFPEIPPHELFKWATENGALALGLDSLGSFTPGKKPGVLLLTGTDPREIPADTRVERLL